MKTITKKKKIVIHTSGPLRIKGGVRGPIEIPYMEEISIIGRMIMSGYKVDEVLSDGTKVKLDLQNYNKENGKNDLQVKEEIVQSGAELNRKPSVNTTINKGTKFNPVIDVYESKK